jgi:hypothetical protein
MKMNRKEEQKDVERGIARRLHDSQKVYIKTGDNRAAIREYCRRNRWLEENARAVGNW